MTTSSLNLWPASDHPSGLECPPRFYTPRNYDRPTYGDQVAKIADALGTPMMPWQRYVADVALEVDPDTGRLVYGEVDLTVPRQSGKTTEILSVGTHRAFAFDGPQSIVYTAQTRGKARKKWAEEHVPALQKSVLGRLIRDVRYANDSEVLYWRNGSQYGIEAGTETSGHGSVNDLAFIDEGFSEVDTRKEDALAPTMITRTSPQLWVVSTAGNRRSVYLRDKVDAGRAMFEPGGELSETLCYFEWSAPDDADPADESVWWKCMPALGHTVTIDAMRKTFDRMKVKNMLGFRRSYLNQWPDAAVVVHVWVIPAGDWTAAEDPESKILPDTARSFAVDVPPDRSAAAVGVSGESDEGLEHIEVVEYERGVSWVAARLEQLHRDHHAPGPVILCGTGALALQKEIEDRGLTTLVMSVKDQTVACAQLADKVPNDVVHIGQESLDVALAGAAKKNVGDGFVWNRRGATDVSPLWAVTGARFGAELLAEIDYDIADSVG